MIVPGAEAAASVVITTCNRKDDLSRALRSCDAQSLPVEVIVVDDNSKDGTRTLVAEQYPNATLIGWTTTRGYIAGRNAAASEAGTNFIFSIDDDAEFSDPKTIERALPFFDDPIVGAISLPYRNLASRRPATDPPPDAEGFWVVYAYVGTAHAVRRDLFLRLGGYDEVFFHQGEEIDFCERLRAAGFVVRLVDTPSILHHESTTRDLTRQDIYGRRNDLYIGWRNAPLDRLPAYWIRMAAKGLLIGWRVRRVNNMLRGLWQGVSVSFHHWHHRHPVPRDVWQLGRRLRARGPLPLGEVRSFLPAQGCNEWRDPSG
jgi:GT2 family glycosyltransferase